MRARVVEVAQWGGMLWEHPRDEAEIAPDAGPAKAGRYSGYGRRRVCVTPAASTMTMPVSSTRTTLNPFDSLSPDFTKASVPLSLTIAVNTVAPPSWLEAIPDNLNWGGGGVNDSGNAGADAAMGSPVCRMIVAGRRVLKTNGLRPTNGVRGGGVSSRSRSCLVNGATFAVLPRGRGPDCWRAADASCWFWFEEVDVHTNQPAVRLSAPIRSIVCGVNCFNIIVLQTLLLY